ncbi:hypothetical protein KY5_2695 [Streptomyces formicae]|uniref:Uncharacterized protein n=1 Tax=Streptomyces formicae TaxID=1616117 RepID=A0A291Q8B6_9ACTN|nr:hypothetical protein KY5_2695 [Streptomyces formicae]
MTSRTRPTGTLTRNTGRQPVPNRSALTRIPPSTCPAAAPVARTAEYAPSAFTRASPAKWRWIRLSTWGMRTAEPAPCASRKAINSPVPWASPQASDAAVKTASPPR